MTGGARHEDRIPDSIESDIAKSAGWMSSEVTGEEFKGYWMNVLKLKRPPEISPHRWTRLGLNRWLYFSLRLEQLFKTLGIKGVIRTLVQDARTTGDDLAWVNEQVRKFTELGLSTPTDPAKSEKLGRWFRAYLKKHASKRKRGALTDFTAAEARIGKPLPASYKAFIMEMGPTTFHDLEEEEGFDALVLGPDDLDISEYRRGKLRVEDEESDRVDGIAFATTGHGDVFCFDLSGGGTDFPVYHYDHELNGFEAYALSFEECIKRFIGE
jgi:hypothetical protein